MKLFNTLSRKVEEFVPISPPKVGMYTCGMTVYDYTHIGHLRKYIGDDILRRALETNSYEVKHVQNVTDVGHLTSDADTGDDKLDKRAKEQGQTVWEVARFFEDYFYKSLEQVNVLSPHIVCRATEHINGQINLIKKLVEKGFTYQTPEAIYFDVSKFPNYGKLSGQKLEDQKVGAREGVVVDVNKKHPADFALWFFTVGHFKDHVMRWSSPWGEGFPGWHIECSAMSMKYLGQTFDIHTGGIDHIPVHHENEIAQSEAATGKSFVKYWVHYEFLLVDGEKMSKSKKNFYTIDDVKERGLNPLALRYLFLTAHYRDKLNFTWESLKAAQNAYDRLVNKITGFRLQVTRKALSNDKFSALKGRDLASGGQLIERYRADFFNQLNNDLGTPGALAVMWEMLKSNIPAQDKYDLVMSFDEVLGLGLAKGKGERVKGEEVPQEVMKLVRERENLRKKEKWEEADEIRKKIEDMGYLIEDNKEGTKIKNKNYEL